MAGRFMKIKRSIIPFMALVIMTSQLAGCATMSSDEMSKSRNESPDVSIEHANHNEDQITELTHEELIGIFELAYDSKKALAGELPVEAIIKQELHIMPYLVTPDKQLPEDYEEQYRAWRPVETQEPEEQQDQSSQTSKPNTNTNSSSTGGPTEVDDGTTGLTTGIVLTDPSKLTEGIDPNQNPWDDNTEIIYGGS
ncbi:hypothetical protein D1641_00230 [Colidextribacter sp. OB.20]|uniref:hypothetical protein n=1 Tax=Colidextribacter sp. OB.20 TaxID=2304568 RepID=UPI00136DEB74|nr:hypothetical protein [Colidextribacter sp. OB.20]NBI08447.1 hypothetical protein [Colidextribacter sp. OB.20]